MLSLKPFLKDQGQSAVQPLRGYYQSTSLRLRSLLAYELAHMSNSLLGVSRRAEWGALGQCQEHTDAKAHSEARVASHNHDNVSVGITIA